MGKSRLEAFSDGVIAILITIMVLEFKTPEGHDWAALGALSTKFSVYLLSFVFLGIYWNNHHHMFAGVGSDTKGKLSPRPFDTAQGWPQSVDASLRVREAAAS